MINAFEAGENLSGAKLAEFKKEVAKIKQMSATKKEVADNDQIGEVIDTLENQERI